MKLNLGSCGRDIPGFVSVDICPPAEIIADLSKRWPWPDSSVDEVLALDIFEHLPSKLHTMNELWRVLKPGGKATIEVPCAAHGTGAFQDPTHVSFWTANDFEYYEHGNVHRTRFGVPYGIQATFRVKSYRHSSYMGAFEEVWKFIIELEAVKGV